MCDGMPKFGVEVNYASQRRSLLLLAAVENVCLQVFSFLERLGCLNRIQLSLCFVETHASL
jgi:hypothetical protein